MFITVKVNDWNDAKRFREYLGAWRFRGHADANWRLASRLERDSNLHKVPKNKIINRERWILKEFKRRVHNYIDNPPANDQTIEWLALLQHYGGSTRLLDFTKSFYVASFFAMENATQDAAVWAIDDLMLIERLMKKTGGSGDETIDQSINRFVQIGEEKFKDENAEKMILLIEPHRMNERLSIQQGSFLFPCNAVDTFEENLIQTLNLSLKTFDDKDVIDSRQISYKEIKDLGIIKIILPRRIFTTALYDLQEMNINSATLFPGLEGFARSLTIYHRTFSR